MPATLALLCRPDVRAVRRLSTASCTCRVTRHFLLLYRKDSPNWANVETSVAVIVPFESHTTASIDQLVGLVAADMERVNATILARTGSEVTMIPEVANHLISSGGKRLRPMPTLAMAHLAGYSGDGPIRLAPPSAFL